MLKTIFLLLWLATFLSCVQKTSLGKVLSKHDFEKSWWAPIEGEKKSWEIEPNTVKFPQVILSKRNELGILSNFAKTSFTLDGKTFGSMEGYWQAMKFPESKKDLRFPLAAWPLRRDQVESMAAFKAKRAGDFGSQVMRKHKIHWVSYAGKKMEYREPKKGPFYEQIVAGMEAKFSQNEEVRKVLCKTKSLQLLPDHHQGANPPPAWEYHKIWMRIRSSNCPES